MAFVVLVLAPSTPRHRRRPVLLTGRRYRIFGSGTYRNNNEVKDVDNGKDVDVEKDIRNSPKTFLRDRFIVCLKVAADPPPPPNPPPTPPPTPLTTPPPPRFNNDKTDAVTLYQLKVRVEVKDNTFTIQHASPPPSPLSLSTPMA